MGVQIILCLARPVQGTIGQRDITQRGLSLLTPFSMLFARRLRDAIAFRASSFAIPLEAAQGLAWEHCLSPKCVKNIQTVSWRLSPSFHLQRSLILLWSLTMRFCPSISLWRTLTNVC